MRFPNDYNKLHIQINKNPCGMIEKKVKLHLSDRTTTLRMLRMVKARIKTELCTNKGEI